jgi:hypothetical protein
MVDAFEALEDAVDSLIDQSTSLRFVGLYHCLSSYTELYRFLIRVLLAIIHCYMYMLL